MTFCWNVRLVSNSFLSDLCEKKKLTRRAQGRRLFHTEDKRRGAALSKVHNSQKTRTARPPPTPRCYFPPPKSNVTRPAYLTFSPVLHSSKYQSGFGISHFFTPRGVQIETWNPAGPVKGFWEWPDGVVRSPQACQACEINTFLFFWTGDSSMGLSTRGYCRWQVWKIVNMSEMVQKIALYVCHLAVILSWSFITWCSQWKRHPFQEFHVHCTSFQG